MIESPGSSVPQVFAEKLTIVLLTYNCAHRLPAVFDRLVEVGVPIIAVDNGSSDDTSAVLAARLGFSSCDCRRTSAPQGGTPALTSSRLRTSRSVTMTVGMRSMGFRSPASFSIAMSGWL
jgi:hypothetical protein